MYSRRDRPFTYRHDSQEELVEFAEAAATHVAEDTDVRLHSNYTVIYKKGVEIYLADTLSRAFHPVAEENKTTEHIFLTDVEKEIEERNMVD